MDKTYLTQVENQNLRALLLKKDNIPILEYLLNAEARRLKPIQKLKEEGKLNFGDKVSSKKLKELLPKIKEEVDSFLETPNIDVPSCKYYNIFRPGLTTTPILILYAASTFVTIYPLALMLVEPGPNIGNLLCSGLGAMTLATVSQSHSLMNSSGYDCRSKSITLKKERRVELIPTIGHEYAHHAQERCGLECGPLDKHPIFAEGHARGIERYLSETYREREDNEAFLYDILDSTISEMKSTYVWMCEELKMPTRESLLKNKTSRNSLPRSHAVGNTLFSIYGAKYGPKIYRDAIHGKFPFKSK